MHDTAVRLKFLRIVIQQSSIIKFLQKGMIWIFIGWLGSFHFVICLSCSFVLMVVLRIQLTLIIFIAYRELLLFIMHTPAWIHVGLHTHSDLYVQKCIGLLMRILYVWEQACLPDTCTSPLVQTYKSVRLLLICCVTRHSKNTLNSLDQVRSINHFVQYVYSINGSSSN